MPVDLQTIVQRMVEAGESEDNIRLVIEHGQSQSAQAPTPAAAPKHLIDLVSQDDRDYLKKGAQRSEELWRNTTEHPARTAATLAAMAGGGGMLPTALRGAAGAGAGLLLKRVTDPSSQPLSVPETLQTMGTEGALQGAFAGAGKGLEKLGTGLYRGGVALLPKTLKQQNPAIAERGLQEGISLTKRGATKAEGLVSASRQQADDLIGAAEQAGAAPVRPMEVVRELRPVAAKMKDQAALGTPSELPTLTARSRSFIAQHPTGIPLTRAQTLKREAQNMANTAYKARDRGAVINSMEALTNESQARGLRKAIEQRVPDVAGVNQRTQELLGVLKGAEHASGTGHILSRLGGALGVGAMSAGAGTIPALGAAGLGGMLTTPGGLTTAGLMTRKAGQMTPGALRAALLAMLASEQQPEQ